MLSNPPQTGGLHARQRQHRRQNSTPSAFEAVKIAPLPNFQHQRPHVSHRRGQSLDMRRQQLSHSTTATATTRQDYTTVSTSTTNTGLNTTPQHILRETQQQRIARPGLGQAAFNLSTNQTDSDDFLLSPHGTPHHQHFVDALAAQGQMTDMSGLPFDAYMGPMNVIIKKNQANFASNNNVHSAQDYEFFGPDSALSTPTFMTFPEASPVGSGPGWISEGETASAHARRTSRRISNGILDKVSKFESMGNSLDLSAQRPTTPPNQNVNGYFPSSPMDTPHNRMIKQEASQQQQQEQQQQQRPNRFSDDYDESMEETIKPMRGNRSSNRNSGIFQDMRQQAESIMQTPPRANTMPMFSNQVLSTPEFMNMSNMNAEFIKIEHGYDGLPTGRLSISSDISSHPSPMTSLGPHNAFDSNLNHNHSDFDSQNTIQPHPSHSTEYTCSETFSRRGSPHRRTDSIASIASAASISSINIEETKTETGVTIDDIATYIEGPDPSDGKWVCIYEDCNKRFGRKENIKSHVQTHLNDRQYQCPTCKKCFVRQHDLKRHAKIHTGVKPYPCECGNSFARHDALTRHRQRGMCIGAFDGIVRKVVKRGRPRKNRPDLDERREKLARLKAKHTSASSVSSQSGYSDSSAANSPSNDFDGIMDDHQFPNMMDVAMGQLSTPGTMDPSNLTVSTAPMPSISSSANEILRNMSPEIHTVSPSVMSNYSHASHSTMAGGDHTDNTTPGPEYSTLPNMKNPASPKSVASQYTHLPGTPPELSASSSPPPTSHSARFYEIDPNTSGISDTSIGLGTTAAAHAAAASAGCGTSGVGMTSLVAMDDDMLLQFDEDGLVQLDQNMMLGKFDDDYDAVNMFTNNDDVFFGN
ncbi:hypothetical protein B0T17DRAFT_593848 [Bombardia bombarda]|uniref:pH-response transcription factor pacC/RIM101 n=1 Tax=Bombardia bombarda TaxID=252184 RepID=A0AA39TR49_9PEZI|nr:hypothetical protein B0T17DRAFT_593848 [Bombardia bombarda]